MSEQSSRIKHENVHLNGSAVKDFFDQHSQKKLAHRYSMVLFQDDNPELAMRRDKEEKERLLPLLKLDADSCILDIGCGVGRWTDAVASLCKEYIGIDFSEELLRVAENLNLANAMFLKGTFQHLLDVLEAHDIHSSFDRILINGVCMYINDDELKNCLSQAYSVLKPSGIILQKESIGTADRLTLRDFYSAELSHKYNAIYRTAVDYEEAFSYAYPNHKVLQSGELFTAELHNRQETTDYYWLLQKNE